MLAQRLLGFWPGRSRVIEILREPLKGRKLQLPLYCLLVGQGATGSYPRAELRGVSPIHLDSCKGTLPRRLLSPKLWTHLAGLTETLAVQGSFDTNHPAAPNGGRGQS